MGPGSACTGKSPEGRELEEAQLARELGVTVRELHGWTPATVTRDAKGRVVSVATSEPRFTRDEVALLLASRRVEQEPRGSHGHLLSQATDPKSRGRWKAQLPTVDFAARELNAAQDAYRKQYPDADMDSLLWAVELRE